MRRCVAMRLALDSVARCAAAWQRDRHDNAAERARAEAIAAPLRRSQFLAGRWLAAELLAQQCGGAPADWRITCVSGEAPRVSGGPGVERPFLSIAHRADAVACAVAAVPIGVDVESDASLRGAADERAEFVLSADEQAAFSRLEPALRASFLLARWTLKEAWAKQTGRGLALGDMRHAAAHAVKKGGNARLWTAQGLVVALCVELCVEGRAEGPCDWPQPRGLAFDHVSSQSWQVAALPRAH